jgi:hypothetical protein
MPGADGYQWRPRRFVDLFSEHRGLRARKWVHYFPVYDRLLFQYLQAGRPLTLLEIGVQNGGSLELWKKYLPPGSQIHGVDINPNCLDVTFSGDIHFHLGDAADRQVTDEIFKDVTFDIILDDGSHISREVISAFSNLFDKVRPGGVYLIEDLFTSYWRGHYGGGLGDPRSSVEFLKSLADLTNWQWIHPREPVRPHLRGIRRALRNRAYSSALPHIRDLWSASLDRARRRSTGGRLRTRLLSDAMQRDLARNVAGVAFFPGISAVWKYRRPSDVELFVVRAGETATVYPAGTDRVFDTADPAARAIVDAFGYS